MFLLSPNANLNLKFLLKVKRNYTILSQFHLVNYKCVCYTGQVMWTVITHVY